MCWLLNKLLDIVLGPEEHFEYQGSTTPDDDHDCGCGCKDLDKPVKPDDTELLFPQA